MINYFICFALFVIVLKIELVSFGVIERYSQILFAIDCVLTLNIMLAILSIVYQVYSFFRRITTKQNCIK